LARITVPTAAASPALFSQSGTGIGPAAILNQDFSANSPSNRAGVGSTVMMFGTGFGALISTVTRESGTLSATALPVLASIAGIAADVMYAGEAPGLPAGVTQVNVRIPNGVPAGEGLPVVIKAGSFQTPAKTTIAVQ